MHSNVRLIVNSPLWTRVGVLNGLPFCKLFFLIRAKFQKSALAEVGDRDYMPHVLVDGMELYLSVDVTPYQLIRAKSGKRMAQENKIRISYLLSLVEVSTILF